MSIWLVYAGYLAAVNPPRLRSGLPEEHGRPNKTAVLGGVAASLVIGVVLVSFADDLLDAFDVTAETWRIAAGMVAAIAGFRVLAFPGRAAEPALRGGWAALVPVAFPLLITPELVALISIFGATEPATRSVGGLALALGVVAGLTMTRHRRPSLWLAGGRFAAAVLVLTGVALIVEGIRDV